jgi:hypothetical protein
MLKMIYLNGRTVPQYFCDVCTTQIENAKGAALVFKRLSELEETNSEVLFTHKGQCHDAAEIKLGGKSKTGWQEMSVSLFHSLHNSQLSPEDWGNLNLLENEFGGL